MFDNREEKRKEEIKTDLANVRDFSIQTAYEAGKIIKDYRKNHQNNITIETKEGNQWYTEADIKSEELIVARIKEAFPDANIISEETLPNLPQNAMQGKCFVIDPIDGTTSYVNGSDHCAISIAYMENGNVLSGVAYLPFTGEVYSAIKGQGAYYKGRDDFEGKKFICPNNRPLKKAVLAFGKPREYEEQEYEELYRFTRFNAKDWYRNPGGVINICEVARGILHSFTETKLGYWDVAAALLIAREAGAKVGYIEGYDENSKVPYDIYSHHVLVAPENLFDELFVKFREINERHREIREQENKENK